MCPQGGFERGLVSLAPNSQGKIVPVYWARVPPGDTVLGAPAAIHAHPEEQVARPANSAPPNYQGIASLQPKTAAPAPGMLPAAAVPVPEETDHAANEPELAVMTAAAAVAAGADIRCTEMIAP